MILKVNIFFRDVRDIIVFVLQMHFLAIILDIIERILHI
jgi:hypothetical protein